MTAWNMQIAVEVTLCQTLCFTAPRESAKPLLAQTGNNGKASEGPFSSSLPLKGILSGLSP